jgi:hypothetical protein
MSAKEYRRRALRAVEEAQRLDDRGHREALQRRARLCMEAATDIEKWGLPDESSAGRRCRQPSKLMRDTLERSG